MEAFERMLDGVRISVERFAHYRLPSASDAEDVLQKVYLSAYRKFPQSKNKDSFRPWIISIAGNAGVPVCTPLARK